MPRGSGGETLGSRTDLGTDPSDVGRDKLLRQRLADLIEIHIPRHRPDITGLDRSHQGKKINPIHRRPMTIRTDAVLRM